jgi:hypothetical protein
VSPEEDALVRVVSALETEGVPYMVTGSVASSYHGRPRSTHDADIVIDPAREQLARLVRRLAAAGFYADEEQAQDALHRRRQFNVIETQSACKIDLIVRKERPFSREELQRRQVAELSPGMSVALASAEDTILSKLEWARKAGGSEKQIADAAGVLEVSPNLDRDYIERWARELGILDLWQEIAAPGPPEA